MHWNGEQMISDGLDKEAAQEVREKGLLTRLNRVLMPEGYILFYAYDAERVGDPQGLQALSLERYVAQPGTRQLALPGVGVHE